VPRLAVGGEEAADVLDDDKGGAERVDGFGVGGPEAGTGALAEAAAGAGEGDVLAGEPAGEDVDGLDARPVDLGDVAVVGDAGEVVLEHA
jgi:hypothetical protein